MTLSPGLATVIMAAIMASVLPQVVTISLLGSISRPIRRLCFSASASRKFCAPQVMEYWWKSSWATSARRFKIAWGGSKSGNPWDRLTAPYWLEMRVIRRMTESVKCAVRVDSGCMGCSSLYTLQNICQLL